VAALLVLVAGILGSLIQSALGLSNAIALGVASFGSFLLVGYIAGRLIAR